MPNKTINTNKIYPFTATTTSQLLFGNNPRRKAYVIYNNGANIVEVCSSSQAYGQGFPIPTGQQLDDDHFNPQGELWVIATGGNTNLRVYEVISQFVPEGNVP